MRHDIGTHDENAEIGFVSKRSATPKREGKQLPVGLALGGRRLPMWSGKHTAYSTALGLLAVLISIFVVNVLMRTSVV